MGRQAGTIELVARELAAALATLEESLAPASVAKFFNDLGVGFPPSVASQASVANALTSVRQAAGDLKPLNVTLSAAISTDNGLQIGVSGGQIVAKIAQLLNGLSTLGAALNGAAGAAPDLSADQKAALQALAQHLPRRLFDAVLIEHLRGFGWGVVPTMMLAGLVDARVPGIGAPNAVPPPAPPAVHLDRMFDLLLKPAKFLSDTFGWNQPSFDGLSLFRRLQTFMDVGGMPAVIIEAPGLPPILEAFTLRFSTDRSVSPPALTARIRVPAIEDVVDSHKLGGVWSFVQEAHARFDEGLDVTIAPPLDMTMRPATGTANVQYRVGFSAERTNPPILILGLAAGSRIEAEKLSMTLGVEASWDGTAAKGRPFGAVTVDRGKVRISAAKADGFIAKILEGFELEAAADFGLDFSPADGLRFRGSSALEIQLASHINAGPVSVDALRLKVGIKDQAFPLLLTADLGTTLGPLTAVVTGFGFGIALSFAPNLDGNLGPLQIAPSIQPPDGVGLEMDGGGFKGGGFLKFDLQRQEYGGGLELDFQGLVTVKAVGLLTTKFPDGSSGFALVIIISAEFAPIQLGLGFTLVGVGGLIGVNRTVDENALRDGVHQGALDSVLFPRDVVANAARIVNDLRRLFPAAADHFLIGPMVKFGWGTPTIVSLEFGLILDIPRPAFFIVGRLRIGLPFQDAPLFDIRVAFAGGVDFDAGQLWFDGTLHDSRLLTFALTGDMAIRLYWKDNPNFVLTIGGFHPAYTPPPMQLGGLQRLGITIFQGNPRLRAETYVAITSNTVQFGAKAELYFGIDLFNVYGFIGLDVLIQFEPFRFVAQLSAMLAVRSGEDVLMGILIDALLEGPKPWHAKGTGHFKISLIISISIDVDFEVTVGDAAGDALPAIDVLPQLVAAFAQPNNWRAVLPAGSNLQVTLRAFKAPEGTIVLHPFGSLEIVEKLVPLNLPVQKLGAHKIADGHVFAVDRVLLGAQPGQLGNVREQFAPAQFIEMPDAQKLSSRSFEKYDAGVRVGGGSAVNADYVKTREVAYEVIYIPRRPKRIRFRLAELLFNAFARGGAVGQSALSAAQTAPSALGTPSVKVEVEHFAVASTEDLTLHDRSMVFASEAEARAAMVTAVDRNPALTRSLQVVPLSQTRAA